jgi:hypothetical protein
MPDVPFLPGVPSLSSYSAGGVVLLVADVLGLLSSLFGSEYAVLFDGVQAFEYNSILDVDFKQDWPISDYPVEDGAFQSYDKVQLPFDIKVRMVSFPDQVSRQLLLAQVLAAANSLDLYDVVTPEVTFTNCNITHVDFRRQSHNGATLLILDVWFVQIRITSTSTFSNTQNPTNQGQQAGGNVTPTTPAANATPGADSVG